MIIVLFCFRTSSSIPICIVVVLSGGDTRVVHLSHHPSLLLKSYIRIASGTCVLMFVVPLGLLCCSISQCLTASVLVLLILFVGVCFSLEVLLGILFVLIVGCFVVSLHIRIHLLFLLGWLPSFGLGELPYSPFVVVNSYDVCSLLLLVGTCPLIF